MITYKVEVEDNGSWIDYTYATILPFSVTERRDTGLDGGEIVLNCIDKSDVFLPYTRVRITTDTKIFRFYVASPEKPQIVYGTAPKYTHTLPLTEITKYMEVVFGETATITQGLNGIYSGKLELVVPSVTYTLPNNWTYEQVWKFATPMFEGGTFKIPSTKEEFLTFYDGLGIEIPIMSVVDIYTNIQPAFLGQEIVLDSTALTTFTIVLQLSVDINATIVYNFVVKEQIARQPYRTISQELTRLCQICELCRNGIDTPRFVIDSEILTKYTNTRCPEFSFSRQTLWEMMLQIGDYIHAIPRLISDENEDWNVITFDFLGSQEEAENNGKLSYIQGSYNIENYATEIDSSISNITNVDNIEEGTLLEPAENIFKTVRVEQGGTEVTDDTALFRTEKPIAKLLKVEVKYNNVVYDITKYCYEAYEYSILSSYQDIFPYSKAYALKYTLGSNNITELQHKNEDFISPAFQNWAIINILNSLGAGISGILPAGLIIGLEYRIEYIPIINSRLRQKKENYHDLDIKATLVYNQSANAVNSSSYGENMKGAILRYGNEETTENYYTNSITAIPKLGTKVGNKYISVINYEFYADFIKYSIEYSENFNRLSGFVGVNSNVRMYEISERQVYDRNLMYNSVVTIGDSDLTKQNANSIITGNARLGLMQTFCADNVFQLEYDPTFAKIVTMRENNEELSEIALPLNTFGLGNSLVFTCNFQDNYSAGEKVIRGEVTNKLIQDYVPYTDEYGGIDKLAFSFCKAVSSTNTQITGDALPEIVALVYQEIINSDYDADLSNGALIIQKDSRENLALTIQIDFVSNRKDIIIGYGWTNTNRLVRSNITEQVKVYSMPRKIGQFEKQVDLTGATQIIMPSTINGWFQFPADPYFRLRPITTLVDCESLAFVNENSDLVLAYNKSLLANEQSESIYFNLN